MKHWMISLVIVSVVLNGVDASSPPSDGFFGPPGTGAPPPPVNMEYEDQIELWRTVNNSLVPFERRLAAERELLLVRDVNFLEVAFAGLVEPVEVIHLPNFDAGLHLRVERREMPIGSTGSMKPEWDAAQPVATQIANARERIWAFLANSAEPAEDRHDINVALFEKVQSEHHLGRLVATGVRRNWTPEVRELLVAIYRDRERDESIRHSAAHTLRDMSHATPFEEQRHVNEQLIATAWEERGSNLARRLGQRWGTKDPRVAALRLDVYDHEVERAGRITDFAVHLIDTYFGNISGSYVDLRSAEGHQRWIEYRDRRMALREEARETGDDTKLRAFEAEVAAQEQAELELRIERIDAWVARNRNRLEREAEAYAEQRRREGEQGEPPSRTPASREIE